MKAFSEFHKHKQSPFGVNPVCKVCRKPVAKAHQAGVSLEYKMYHRCRNRAKQKGLEFDLELGDFVVPELCPVFHRPLVVGDPQWTPSVDRIDPTKGYVKGNIQIISNRANMAKNDLTIEELEMLISFLKGDKCDIF